MPLRRPKYSPHTGDAKVAVEHKIEGREVDFARIRQNLGILRGLSNPEVSERYRLINVESFSNEIDFLIKQCNFMVCF